MDIGIVGGGFSGTLLAANLLAEPSFTGRVFWWERRAQRGQGIAYSTTCPAHVLNVPARNMAAFAERPAHLVDWWQAQEPGQERAVSAEHYLPRRRYAERRVHR